jgi:Putative addiction module component
LARILLDLSEPDQDFSPQVETAWEQEIERRMGAIKSGIAESKAFEQVFAELDRRFPS